MADYEVLAPGGHENLINNVTERLDEKAYIDGYYQQLTAGAADNLTGRGDGVSASYLYRTTGGDADVADGTATVKSIHGRTLVWNQLAPLFSSGWIPSSNTTATVSQDGRTLMLASTSDTAASKGYAINLSSVGMSNSHVYYIAATIDASSTTYYVSFGFFKTNGTHALRVMVEAGSSARRYSAIGTPTDAVNLAVRLNNGAPSGESAIVSDCVCIDLTRMFGAGNEPSTVTEFEALYPEPYYPYDAGSLLSVQMEGIETVGFNQWDEVWEVGGFNNETGQKNSSTTVCRSKNYIHVFPNTTYYYNKRIAFYYYDADKNYVGRRTYIDPTTITTGPNVHYVMFMFDGTTMPSGLCINLSWSGYRNGEYEPYWQSERTIPAATYFPNGMRSAGTVYDELTSDAAVTRVGVVDLGTLDWVLYEIGNEHTFRNSATTPIQRAAGVSNLICAEYSLGAGGTSLEDMQVAGGANSATVYVRNNTCTTAAEMKSALDGVILYYELATPTTTPIDPPLNLSYKVSDFGTERVMHTNPTAAPTQQVVYGLNVVDTVRRLPTEYISHDSFTQFRLALGAKLGVFIVETWDETDNRYEYTINDA